MPKHIKEIYRQLDCQTVRHYLYCHTCYIKKDTDLILYLSDEAAFVSEFVL